MNFLAEMPFMDGGAKFFPEIVLESWLLARNRIFCRVPLAILIARVFWVACKFKGDLSIHTQRNGLD